MMTAIYISFIIVSFFLGVLVTRDYYKNKIKSFKPEKDPADWWKDGRDPFERSSYDEDF